MSSPSCRALKHVRISMAYTTAVQGATVTLPGSSTRPAGHSERDLQGQVRCCFTSTETTRTVRDGEPRTATSAFTQLLSSQRGLLLLSYSAQLQHCEHSDIFSACWFLFVCFVSREHRILTWTTGSLTCVCDLFACVYRQGTSDYSLIRRTFVESAQNLTPEKSQGGRKSLAKNGHQSIW